jgi:transcriptional regulator with XRE-family HTH domain
MGSRDLDTDTSLTREMGARLRLAREEQGVSLRALAQGIDVSPSLLSQIENGLARPSVGTLWALVNELRVSLDSIFDVDPGAGPGTSPGPAPSSTPGPAREEPAVQRAGDRRVIELSGGVRWEQLDASHDPGVVFAFVTYEPGVETERHPPARHTGREYGYMVSGRLAIEIDDRRVEVGPGDAISFDSRHPHRFSAVGEEAARAVWFNVTG